MNGRSDDYRFSFEFEAARQESLPEIQMLFDVGNVGRLRFALPGCQKAQAYLPQMKAMRILAQPVEKPPLPLGTGVIADHSAVSVVLGQAQGFRVETARQG